MTHNEQGLLQGWNSLLVRPEPLLNKDIKVQVNKQKPKIERPAQMKHTAIKCPLLQLPASLAANPMLYAVYKVRPFLINKVEQFALTAGLFLDDN